MDRVSEFPKQDSDGMVAELWLALSACLLPQVECGCLRQHHGYARGGKQVL